jgi:nucleoside-diphosphate-sugar epimerase
MIKKELADKYTEDITLESNRIQKELGFVPQYTLDAGWLETIREMRESGLL